MSRECPAQRSTLCRPVSEEGGIVATAFGRTITTGLVLIATVSLAAACDSSPPSAGLDCPSQLRFHGVTYTGYRFTGERATRLGHGTRPVCGETDLDAGESVAVWSFPGRSPSKVIGSPGYHGRLVVYVANSVKLRERAQILAAIGDQTSSTPTAAPESPKDAELPPNFIGTMARHGYVLTKKAVADGAISGDAAIEQARQTFPLFQASDPSVATYFLVTTPRGGRLKDVNNPYSDVEPGLNKTPMWVVYAQADMLKDDNDPSLGWVRGTVVAFVDATTGQAEQAITY